MAWWSLVMFPNCHILIVCEMTFLWPIAIGQFSDWVYGFSVDAAYGRICSEQFTWKSIIMVMVRSAEQQHSINRCVMCSMDVELDSKKDKVTLERVSRADWWMMVMPRCMHRMGHHITWHMAQWFIWPTFWWLTFYSCSFYRASWRPSYIIFQSTFHFRWFVCLWQT